MSLIVKSNNEEHSELVAEGIHLAVCIGVWELGTQHNPTFNKDLKKVLIMWEIVDKDILNAPTISKIYTLSLDPKSTLRHDLELWRGKVFTDEEIRKGVDLRTFLGKGCQIQVIHQKNKKGDKTYANISGIMGWPKDMQEVETVHTPIFFEIEDEKIPEGTPAWIQRMIMNSEEYQMREQVNHENDYPIVYG